MADENGTETERRPKGIAPSAGEALLAAVLRRRGRAGVIRAIRHVIYTERTALEEAELLLEAAERGTPPPEPVTFEPVTSGYALAYIVAHCHNDDELAEAVATEAITGPFRDEAEGPPDTWLAKLIACACDEVCAT